MSAQLTALARIRLRFTLNGWRQDVRLRTAAWIQTVLLAGLTIAGALWISVRCRVRPTASICICASG